MTSDDKRPGRTIAKKADPDLIIKGGIVITMVNDHEPMIDASVFIKDRRIMDIQPNHGKHFVEDGHAEIINAKEAIVLPGLVNAHTHAAMTLFRGLADDLPLKQWLFDKIFPAEAKFLNEETVYYGSLLGCLEMIASGTTCFSDGYFFQDSTVRAVHESGLRALIAQGVIDFPAPGVDDPERNLDIGREFIEKWFNYSPLITPGLFCHSLSTCSDKTLIGAKEISLEYSLPLQIHLSETRDEVDQVKEKSGKLPVPYLDELGILDIPLIAVHSVHLSDAEIESIYRAGLGIGGGASSSDTSTVTVDPVQDAPTASNNTITTNEDTAYTFNAADFNFSDVDGESLTQVQITSLETAGSLQLNGLDVDLNDVISIADPTASPDLISPRMFREMVKPAITRIVDAIKGVSFLHICGNSTPIIRDMTETGVDSVNISEKVDIWQAKQIVEGKAKVTGNVSSKVTLALMKPIDVLVESRAAIEAGVDILAPSCGIAPMTPNENLKALVKAARNSLTSSSTVKSNGSF